AGIIRQAGQPGRQRTGPRLDEGVLGKGRAVLGLLREIGGLVQTHWVDADDALRVEHPPQLRQLPGVAAGHQQPDGHRAFPGVGSSPGYGAASASRWSANSFSQPACAESSMASRASRPKAAPSAVPCTSTSLPPSVHTTFMSTSARESSSYGRSHRTRPSTTPTLTAASAPVSGLPVTAPEDCSHVTASASAT